MGRDTNVVPATIVFMLAIMIRADVIDVGFRALAGPEHGRRAGRNQSGNFACRIADIAEDTGTADTRVDTRRNQSFGNPVNAEIALFDDLGDRVEEPCIVGAGLDAIFATDALAAIDDDDAVLLTLVGGSRRANIDALGMAAMIAKPWQEMPRDVWIYPVHVRTRKSLGDMMRKLSDTSSHKSTRFLGTSSFMNPSMAAQNSLKVA